MIPFIEKAIHQDVKRFVLLGSVSVSAVTDIVERVTGCRPISFEQFVQTHVGTWK